MLHWAPVRFEVERVTALGYRQEVQARRGVQRAAPAVCGVLQAGGLGHLHDLAAAGEAEAAAGIELKDVDAVAADDVLVGLGTPLVLAGADRRGDGGAQPCVTGEV